MTRILGIDLGVKSAITLSIYRSSGDIFKYELDKEEPDWNFIHKGVIEVAPFVISGARDCKANVIALEELRFKNLKYGKFLQLLSDEIKNIVKDKIKIILVDPINTSRRCRNCGAVSEYNRLNSGEDFRCIWCGHDDNADVNAAKNIAILCAIKLARKAIKSGQPWKRRFYILETASKTKTCVNDIDWAVKKIRS